MKNYLLQKRYFKGGGITLPYNSSVTNFLNQNQFNRSFNSGLNNSYNPYANSNQNAKYGLNDNFSSMDVFQAFNNKTGNSVTDTKFNPLSIPQQSSFKQTLGKIGNGINAAMPYVQAAQQAVNLGIDSYKTGASNNDIGKANYVIGTLKGSEQQANNVAQSYSAGQTEFNTMDKLSSGISSQKDLKTGKDWKNVLGSTGKGAGIGASAGTMIMPGIGTAIGAIGGALIGGLSSGIGAIFAKNKRKKEAEKAQISERNQNYAVDYFNSKQAEQLQSANDNAAKAQANQIRSSVLSLVAFGGKLNRKNYLLSDNLHF